MGPTLGQHGAHLGPTGPRWSPCWPHELCYLGSQRNEPWHRKMYLPSSGNFVNLSIRLMYRIFNYLLFLKFANRKLRQQNIFCRNDPVLWQWIKDTPREIHVYYKRWVTLNFNYVWPRDDYIRLLDTVWSLVQTTTLHCVLYISYYIFLLVGNLDVFKISLCNIGHCSPADPAKSQWYHTGMSSFSPGRSKFE